ncbi:MAG: DinB family protein [Chloroflexales bacterium]|nr:DinB family protein [Chloroflexales bacterium]
MDVTDTVARLEAQALAIAALARAAGPAQVAWKPSPDAWSTLEVVCHLYDEEREDFRARIDATLHRPDELAPEIDPEGWVTARDYASRDPAATLEAFLAERRRSLDWLRGLRHPDWERPLNHPSLARYGLRAGDILASWAAHDLLHLRQLVELRYQYLASHAAPYGVQYAGDW